MRQKWSWTKLQTDRANNVLEIVNELKPWYPLTLRQIYYRLVGKGYIENNISQYIMLSKLVKWMRIDNILPWSVLEDRTRSMSDKKGFDDLDTFINEERSYFLQGYSRCLIQGQENYIEVWTEKDALSKIFEDVTYPYCIRTIVCKGYQSITFIADFYTRARKALQQGQQPIVLYAGDLDPSGVQMLEATIETLESELGLYGVDFRRIALNPDQVDYYDLPHNPKALKKTDPRARKYIKRFGTIAVELDALHPSILSDITRNAIESVVDMELFEQQQEVEEMETVKIEALRKDINKVIDERVNI